MRKMVKRGMALTAACLTASLAGLGGCGDASSVLPGYKPYDDSLRVEDARELTDNEYSVFNTVATDDFGRTFFTMDGKEGGQYVGMFYFICNGWNRESTGLYDVSKITKHGAENEAFQVDNTASPVGAAHYWGEPVFGYYNSQDPWVMRKHIEMLTMAGVDFLVFDVSNAFTYMEVTDVLFPIMQEYYDAGWDVPKFMYYTRHGSATSCKNEIASLYNKYYKNGLYKDLWFAPYEDKKPLMLKFAGVNYPSGDEIGEFFHFRSTQWPTEAYNADGIPWMEFTFPQPAHNGWMNVAIAAHSETVRMSDLNANPGRGATWFGEDNEAYFINDHENYRKGPYFEQQWDHLIAHKDEVQFAFVTGWNEWTATKMVDAAGTYFTVDNYNTEFSRDIEPTRTDGMGDNFYLQTIRKIRQYRATEAKHYIYPQKTIDVTKDDEAWKDVKTYLDFTGECKERNFKPAVIGSSRQKLTNKTGRNDIESIKIARDKDNLYFRVTTVDNITSYESGDKNWMNLWIRTKNGAGDMLNGYNYVINREVNGTETAIMRTKSATDIQKCGTGEVHVYGKTMIVRIPLSALHLSETDYTFDFKVTDNVDFTKNYLNLYDTGDVAPCGRLNFSYGY